MIIRTALAAMAIGFASLTVGTTAGSKDVLAFGSAPAPKPCAKHKWGSKRWKRCRRRNGLPTSATEQTEEALTLGYTLAMAGQYEQALTFLRPEEAANDPRVLTYIGFSERKLGRVTAAMGYYKRAIALAPHNVATLSYMGEAHLQVGDLAAAKTALHQIGSLCGVDCEPYRALDTAVQSYVEAS